jgi:hypothetical protein
MTDFWRVLSEAAPERISGAGDIDLATQHGAWPSGSSLSRSAARRKSRYTSCCTRFCADGGGDGEALRRSELWLYLAMSSSRIPSGPITTRSQSTPHARRSGPGLCNWGRVVAGFYSYEGLENLVSCQIHNVMEIRLDL